MIERRQASRRRSPLRQHVQPDNQERSYAGAKVLVTGADGFIGSHLTEALTRCGAEVTALSLYNSFDSLGWLDDLPPRTLTAIRCVRGDVRDSAFVRRLCVGQDVIFHLAALIAIPYSYAVAHSYVETNVVGTLNVLEAARENHVSRVIHTSTSEVYGSAQTLPISECHPLHGQSPYSASKIAADMMAEAYARSFDLNVVILRPFNSFGPRQSERAIIPMLIRQYLDPACTVLKVGETTTVRDFTFVADTVSAFMSAGLAPMVETGTPYNAGSGIAVSVGELIEILSDITGTIKAVVHEDVRMRPRNSEVRALCADSSKLFADIGWRPRISFRDGLTTTIDWWRDRIERGRVRNDNAFIT